MIVDKDLIGGGGTDGIIKTYRHVQYIPTVKKTILGDSEFINTKMVIFKTSNVSNQPLNVIYEKVDEIQGIYTFNTNIIIKPYNNINGYVGKSVDLVTLDNQNSVIKNYVYININNKIYAISMSMTKKDYFFYSYSFMIYNVSFNGVFIYNKNVNINISSIHFTQYLFEFETRNNPTADFYSSKIPRSGNPNFLLYDNSFHIFDHNNNSYRRTSYYIKLSNNNYDPFDFLNSDIPFGLYPVTLTLDFDNV